MQRNKKQSSELSTVSPLKLLKAFVETAQRDDEVEDSAEKTAAVASVDGRRCRGENWTDDEEMRLLEAYKTYASLLKQERNQRSKKQVCANKQSFMKAVV